MPKLKINHINSFQVFQVFKYGSSILVSIALAKSYLTLSDLGVFESFIFYSSSISFFWIIGITQGLLTSYPDAIKNINNKKTLFYNTYLLILIFSFISVLAIWILYQINPSKISASISPEDFLLFFIYNLINPSTFLIEFILLLEKQYNTLIKYGIISLVLPFLIIGIPAFLGFTVSWCFLGLILWATIKNIYLISLMVKYSLFKLIKSEMQQLLKLSSPLIFTALLVGSATYIDSLIISLNYDSNTFAIFRYGAREFPLFLLIANAFGSSMIPLLAKKENLEKNLAEIKSNSKRMMHYSFPIAIVLLASSQFIFPLVFNKNFNQSYKVFDIYLLLIISRFIFPQTILMGLKKNMLILQIAFLELVVNVIASLTLIQYFGYLGVAYGTLVAYFFEKIILAILLRQKIQIPSVKYIAFKDMFTYSAILLSIYVLKVYLNA